MTLEEINERFDYHPPNTASKVEKHETVRSECKALALVLNDLLPYSREASLAITHLEDVMFWSNAAIARN